jgi:glycosyltransferase involved in cell wall biosynthesis
MTSTSTSTLTIISVMVPTYRRPADLKRCLDALRAQARPADEVLVIARPEDDATHRALETELSANNPFLLRVIETGLGGQVAALNRGLDAARGDIIAITDDDAAPRVDWLAQIDQAFSNDQTLGALGGRDWVFERGALLDGERSEVGVIRRTGKICGNHHLGVGAPRTVSLLKGANMIYRRSAVGGLRFDTRLRGKGAQPCNDLSFSLSVRHTGWKMVYDPRVAVDHFPAERFDDNGRDAQTLGALADTAYNLHLVLREHLGPFARHIAWYWYAAIGTRAMPGFAHALLALTRTRDTACWARYRAMRKGAQDARRDAQHEPAAYALAMRGRTDGAKAA